MLTLMYTATKLRYDSVKPKLLFPRLDTQTQWYYNLHDKVLGFLYFILLYWTLTLEPSACYAATQPLNYLSSLTMTGF